MRHLSRARLLHRVPRRRPGGPGHPGASAGSSIPGASGRSFARRRATQIRPFCSVTAERRARTPPMRHVPHAGQLSRLPPGEPNGGTGHAAGGAGPRARRAGRAEAARLTRHRLLRQPCRPGIGPAAELRRVSRSHPVSGLPPPQCRGSESRIPSRRFPDDPSRCRLHARSVLRRLPQPVPVLRQLSSERRSRLQGWLAGRRIPRREGGVSPQPWSGRATEPGELRLLSFRAGLSDLPLRSGRSPVQSSRSRLRSGNAPPQEPLDVHRLPRDLHPG